MPFAILRFEKRRGGTASAIEKHHERGKEAYKSNPDIDKERATDNYHLKAPQNRYYYEVQSRIEAAECRVRRDSVKYVDTFIGGTHEFIRGLPVKEQREYFDRAYSFIAERVGEKNIFSAIVHMDEYTPHLHLCFVPLTRDNRLTAKEVLGNRESMIRWQDDFHNHMSERWPLLERGRPAAETGRKHIPTRLHKQALRLDEKAQEISDALANINILNAGKKREEALQIIARWLPDAESFTGQVKTVDGWIHKLEKALHISERKRKDDISDLKDKIEEKDESLSKYRSEVYRLQEAIRQQERMLKRIPPEVLEELKKNRDRNIIRVFYPVEYIKFRINTNQSKWHLKILGLKLLAKKLYSQEVLKKFHKKICLFIQKL